MESDGDSEFIFYGIPIIFESYVRVDRQAKFYWHLFIHPGITAAQAYAYLNNDFQSLHHKRLMRQWKKEIEDIVSNTSTNSQYEELMKKTAKKVSEWNRLFMTIIYGDIEELAYCLCIDPDELFNEIYSNYLEGQFSQQEIHDFLEYYSFLLSEDMIDAMLDRYDRLLN